MLDADALRAVRLVVFDFDGVFTDNRVSANEPGEGCVRELRDAIWRGRGAA